MLSEEFRRKYKKNAIWLGVFYLFASCLELFLTFIETPLILYGLWFSGAFGGIALFEFVRAFASPRLTLLEWTMETAKEK